LIPSVGRFSVLLGSSQKRVYGLVKVLKGDGRPLNARILDKVDPAMYRVFDTRGTREGDSMREVAGASELSEEALLNSYRTMRTIREFEERLHVEFATGEIPGFVHLYAGEEAIAAGVCAHLNEEDYVASTHRGHGHAIAKGCDVKAMMKEIYGKADGLCHGKGGSMHIADLDKGMLGANGIVGGGPPLVCGVGLSSKVRGTKQVGVSFTGDGGSNQGTTLESLNLAAVWELPVVFIIENNGYAEATSTNFSTKGIDIAKRADGFGIPAVVVDGHDFFAVYEAAGEAILRAREGGGPTLIECKVNRYYGHFEGDAQTYRAPGEVEEIRREKDCLDMFRWRVTEAGLVEKEELDKIDEEVKTLIDEAVDEAKAAQDPTEDQLLTDVYVSY
jgi:acetoin:2,6-dichlorophenolindophenol oxidoreductase subunit alpha